MAVKLAANINPAIKRMEIASLEAAPVIGYLMTPISLIGYVLAIWRLMADLKWLGSFFIEDGLFSHWQVWLALAIGVQMLASYLSRSGRSDNTVTS